MGESVGHRRDFHHSQSPPDNAPSPGRASSRGTSLPFLVMRCGKHAETTPLAPVKKEGGNREEKGEIEKLRNQNLAVPEISEQARANKSESIRKARGKSEKEGERHQTKCSCFANSTSAELKRFQSAQGLENPSLKAAEDGNIHKYPPCTPRFNRKHHPTLSQGIALSLREEAPCSALAASPRAKHSPRI